MRRKKLSSRKNSGREELLLSPRIQECLKSRTKLLLFGGKGGVGKTTVAAATAVLLAQAGRSVLIISSDPAPSLSDIFETQIGGTINEPVKGIFAIELDVRQSIEKYKAMYGGIIVDALATIVPVDREILSDIPDDVAPGFDEIFALGEVLTFMGKGYDYLVWDTAPTGHTLRLLSLPDTIQKYADAMSIIHKRVEGILATIKTVFDRETETVSIDEVLSDLRETALYMHMLLSDPARTEFVPVIIPEALALNQTIRLKATLDELGVPVRRMVVNGIVPKSDCPFCMSRRAVQMKYLAAIREQFAPGLTVIEMPLFPFEMKGLGHLLRYAHLLQSMPDFLSINPGVSAHG